MKYRFMEENRSEFSVEKMAQLLDVSKSGYYDWRKERKDRVAAERDLRFDMEIRLIFEGSRGRYGSVKIHDELRKRGFRCSRTRVATRMKTMGLRSKTVKKFRVTTDSKHSYPVSPNLLNRHFTVEVPDRVWVSDITYLWTKSGWLYLCVVLDLFSRKVVGWALKNTLEASLVTEAFNRAFWSRKPGPELMIHSDRGVQYACAAFRELLASWKCVQSMSRKGNCWDNAVSESFFRIFKVEFLYHIDLMDENHARSEIFEYLEIFYNRQRIHSTLNYQTPEEFERIQWQKVA